MPVCSFEDWSAWVEANDQELWNKVLTTDIRKVDQFLQEQYELYKNGKRKESSFLAEWRQPYAKISKYIWSSNYANLILGNRFPCEDDLEFISGGCGEKKVKRWCLMSEVDLPGFHNVDHDWYKILPFDDRQSIKLSEVRACLSLEIIHAGLSIMYS